MDAGPLLPLDLDHLDARNVGNSAGHELEPSLTVLSVGSKRSASKPTAGNVDLNIFSIGNVPDSRPNKRIAHLLVGLILIGE